jgi:hypothetical protein
MPKSATAAIAPPNAAPPASPILHREAGSSARHPLAARSASVLGAYATALDVITASPMARLDIGRVQVRASCCGCWAIATASEKTSVSSEAPNYCGFGCMGSVEVWPEPLSSGLVG